MKSIFFVIITEMADKKRFPTITNDSLKALQLSIENKNTKSQDEKWERVFKSFLNQHDMHSDFYDFDIPTLNEWLSKLWFGARQDNSKKKNKTDVQEDENEGKRYHANSLHAMRYAINRLLKKSGRKFDITKSDEFIPCQLAFEDAIKELKILGYGYVINHIEILPEGEKIHKI